MSRFKQEHACSSKNVYTSYNEAKAALRRLLRKDYILKKGVECDTKQFHIYRCPYGSHWHLGHEVKD